MLNIEIIDNSERKWECVASLGFEAVLHSQKGDIIKIKERQFEVQWKSFEPEKNLVQIIVKEQ